MKKILIIALTAVLPSLVSAQRIDKPGEPYYVYCTVSSVIDATLVIGEDEDEFYILDDKDNKIKFENGTQVRTYMSKRGWEYVERTGNSDFLFRKKVKSDEEAFSDFKMIYRFGKNKGKSRN